MSKIEVKKLNCFTQGEWEYYIQDVPFVKNGKRFDVCSDCTVQYQRQMSKEGKCEFPMKRIEKLAEYA
jgi:hypothetical protein